MLKVNKIVIIFLNLIIFSSVVHAENSDENFSAPVKSIVYIGTYNSTHMIKYEKNDTIIFAKPKRERNYAAPMPGGSIYPEPRRGDSSSSYFRSLNLTEDFYYVMMQFEDDGDLSEEQAQILTDDNIAVFEWHGDRTYYAKVPRTILENKSYDFVRWIEIPEIIRNNKIHSQLNVYKDPNKLVNVTVELYEKLNNVQFQKIESLSNRILEYASPWNAINIEISIKNMNTINNLNFIKSVYKFDGIIVALDRSSIVVAADHVHDLGPNDASGITVGIIDSGLQFDNQYFSAITRYKAYDYTDSDEDPTAECSDGDNNCTNCVDGDVGVHGVHVAGIVSGSGVFGNRSISGVSNNATLLIQRTINSFQQWSAPDPQYDDIWKNILDPDNDTDYIEDNSSDIISVSWYRNGTLGDYILRDKEVDRVVRGELNKSVLVVIAAGNFGENTKVASPSAAKNAITVGASADYHSPNKNSQHIPPNTACGLDYSCSYDDTNEYVMEYSSRGTNDGRVKPDILAPGSDITSKHLDGGYCSSYGTSFAAPHVSAVVAQILKQYTSLNLTPAAIKAFLLSSAIEGGTTDNTSTNQGWGRLDAYRAVYKLSDEYTDIIVVNDPININEDKYVNIDVPSGADKLVTTLVWSDIPGDASGNQTKTLYDNLDLYLIYPNGTTLNWTVNDDDKNNVEKYVINNPVSGTWQAHVKFVSGNSTAQNFSLKFEVIKQTSSPSIQTVENYNTTTIEVNGTFSVNITATANGLSTYDMWTKITYPFPQLSLETDNLDGTSSSMDVLGDVAAGKSRTSRSWVLKGLEAGTYTVTINVNGTRLDGATIGESSSEIVYVKKSPGMTCSSASECFSGYCEGSQSNSARCCSSAPPSDGYLYCSGAIRQNRDYYCDSSGAAQYEVINSEDCSSKASTETDGGNVPGTSGACTDYVGCSAGSCTSNNYNDACASSINLTEYYVSGAFCPLQYYLCSDIEVLATGDIADDPTTTGTCTAGSGASCSSGAFTTASGNSGTDICEGACGTGTNSCVFREYYAVDSADACSGLDTCASTTYDADTNSNTCNTCKGVNFWNLGGDISNCCGDDSSENKQTRVCSSGVCNSNSTDDACCTATDKCVYSSICYADGFLGDVDSDSVNEYCTDGNWTEPPASSINLYNFSVLSSENSKRVFEFRINATSVNNATWNLTTGDGTIINSSQNISFGIDEIVFVFAEYNYTENDLYNVTAAAYYGNLSDSESITINVGNLIVTYLGVLYSNLTETIFEIRILNNMNGSISGLNWTLVTGEAIINASNLINLQPQETAFVFVNYNYTSTGNYTVNVSVANGTLYDDKTIPITVNASNYDVKLYNFTVLNSNNTERVFEFLIKNTGSVALSNIEWNMTVSGEAGVVGVQTLNLTVGELVRVLVNYNYTTGGLHNVTAKADPNNLINENKENDNAETIYND